LARPTLFLRVFDPPFAVIDRRILERTLRQVADLPRIGVAEPERRGLSLASVRTIQVADLPRIGVAEPSLRSHLESRTPILSLTQLKPDVNENLRFSR